jgi:hypothetical protein
MVLIRPGQGADGVPPARAALASAGGHGSARIARQLSLCENAVRKRRRRYADARLARLADAPVQAGHTVGTDRTSLGVNVIRRDRAGRRALPRRW